jgi:hypothetical protein
LDRLGTGPSAGLSGGWLEQLRPALTLLVEAHGCATTILRNVWDFAVEFDQLRQAGMTHSQFRLLVCLGLVEHAAEVTPRGQDGRSFQPEPRLVVSSRTCVVLTEAGRRASNGLTPGRPGPRGPAGQDRGTRPVWDEQQRILLMEGAVVKHFRQPAFSQELLLAAFEEEGWPHRIDDPLPPVGDRDPKERLRTTIKNLNRNQATPALRFLGDGTGRGVLWRATER